jgi:hypothetical protein
VSDEIYRNELPRIYELRDAARSQSSPIVHFIDFENKLVESPLRLKHFRDIEAELRGLSASAWNDLKSQLRPLLTVKSKKRGSQALFDKLNEAKGYNHLVNIGCSDVGFIPVSRKKGLQTPDLKGILSEGNILCEVKTINISQDEATRRADGAAGRVFLELPKEFFGKLKSDLESAQRQMLAYDAGGSARWIAYVVVNFDDNLHEYADDYSRQIEAFVGANAVPGIETFFHIKPAFYSARDA